MPQGHHDPSPLGIKENSKAHRLLEHLTIPRHSMVANFSLAVANSTASRHCACVKTGGPTVGMFYTVLVEKAAVKNIA